MINRIGIRIYKYLSNEQVLDILSRYDEPHRFYHTRQHLSEIFNYLDEYVNNDYDNNLTDDDLDKLSISTYFQDRKSVG